MTRQIKKPLKRVTSKLIYHAYDEVCPVIKKGKFDLALSKLQEKYRIGLETLNARDRTLLEVATNDYAYNSFPMAVKFIDYLITDKGCDVNFQDKYGYTPLHIAANYRLPELCRLFLSRGADITIAAEFDMTALDLVVCQCKAITCSEYLVKEGKEIITTLLEAGADPYREYDSKYVHSEREPRREKNLVEWMINESLLYTNPEILWVRVFLLDLLKKMGKLKE